MGDEADGLPGEAAFGHRGHVRLGAAVAAPVCAVGWSYVLVQMGELGHGHAALLGALAHDAEVMRCTGGLEVDLAFEAFVVDPVQGLLVLVALEHDGWVETGAAPDRDEHEDV